MSDRPVWATYSPRQVILWFACAACCAVAACVSTAVANTVTLELTPPADGRNLFDIELVLNESEILTETDTVAGSGWVEAALDLETVGEDAVAGGLTLTGGAVSFDEMNFSFGGVLFITGTDVVGTPRSLVAPSAVTAGMFDAAEHELLVEEGMFVVSGLFSNEADLAEMPFRARGNGSGSITLTELDRQAGEVTYEAELLWPISFTDRVQDFEMGDPVDLDLTVDGLLHAKGQFVYRLVAGIPGDYNDDDVVDAADYTLWQDHIGSSTPLANDPHGPPVGQAQYEQWTMNFGMSAGEAGARLTALPEPHSILLAAAALLAASPFARRGLRGLGL